MAAMAYDFSRFSPQSFERFIQAMAAAAVGSRIQVYGRGKDGAREATFKGACRIADGTWDGYVVFQAKYRDGDSRHISNADWLIQQINQEINKFNDPKRALEKPDYYVIASNVQLSAAAADSKGKGQGGIDKVTNYLRVQATKIGIKDIHLWHSDTLSSLLDVHRGVRTTFDFWIQPGDVLAAILQKISGPNQSETLTKYLQDSLRQSREIKTKDIGQAVGRTVTLDQVFIDLPVSRRSVRFLEFDELDGSDVEVEPTEMEDGSPDQPSEHNNESESDLGILAQIVQQAANTFIPHSWEYEHSQESIGGRAHRPLPNRVVLLGGPGQGKSTVGQFLAQFSRARLLKSMEHTQSPETIKAVNAILATADALKIPRTGPLRYPFHVELPRYADLLNESTRADGHLPILDYLAREIGRGGIPGLSAATVAPWLKSVPSFIILDGLDEVPHSGNRAEVIRAVEELLATLHTINADAFVFATSRPQGYQEELSPEYWAHWELDALKVEHALGLAARVAPVLITETTRREDVLAILAEAAEEDATASLMTSPLQVMLLFHLVSTHNNIPKDRWTLFHRHYEILRDREIAKGGASGATIRAHKPQIDRIHHDAGYLLHLRAEASGGANAYFTNIEFESLVRKHLKNDGFLEELDLLTTEIANLATNRLVFLSSAVEGNVAFDVRSLQEFMAAARITSSPEASIRDRLYEVIGRAHWQHVVKIAFSKIYASTGHESLHDTLIGLLDALDKGDRSLDDSLIRTGSMLAIELLRDGTMASVPNYRRKLLARVMALASEPEKCSHLELSHVLDPGQRALLEPLFKSHLNGGRETRISALKLLVLLSFLRTVGDWTVQLALDYWPEDHNELFDLLDEIYLLPSEGPLADRLRLSQWKAPPAAVARWVDNLQLAHFDEPFDGHDVIVCSGNPPTYRARLLTTDGAAPIFQTFYAIQSSVRVFSDPPPYAAPSWRAAKAAFEFSEAPSLEAAALFLEAVRNQYDTGTQLGIALPWPLEVLLRSISIMADFDTVIADVRDGKHGDFADWKRKEQEWKTAGIPEAAAMEPIDCGALRTSLVNLGSPPVVSRRLINPKPSNDGELLGLVSRWPECAWAKSLVIDYAARGSARLSKATLSFLLQIEFEFIERTPGIQSKYLSTLIKALPRSHEIALIISRISSISQNGVLLLASTGSSYRSLVGLINEYPNLRGLIPALARIALSLNGRSSAASSLALPQAAFVRAPEDTAEIGAGISQLRILIGHPSLNLDIDLQYLFKGTESQIFDLMSSLSRHSTRDASRSALIHLCREIILRRMKLSEARALQLLHNFDEALPVNLNDERVSQALSLPEPLLPH